MALRYSQALAERAQAYLARSLADKRSAQGLAELAEVWAATQGLGPVECRQCQYSERHADLGAYVRNFFRYHSATAMSETAPKGPTYSLAPAFAGQTLVSDSYGKAVTADNLEDEDAEHFIGLGYAHAFLKNGKPLPKKKGAADETPADETPANPDLLAEQQAHQATGEALESEKAAHAETKQQLSQVQHQLETSQKELAKATAKAEKAAKKNEADGEPK